LFKKQGKSPKPTSECKEASKMSNEEWNKYFNGHWQFNGVRQDKHLAMFPEELPHRLIKMFSFVGDKILDPFLGSGTTSLAAKNLSRNSIGYEINSEYIDIIKEKIENKDIFSNYEISEIKQSDINVSTFKQRIDSFGYKFVDTHKIDKKIDVKKFQFGSKIDSKSSQQKDGVKSIVNREVIEEIKAEMSRIK
jgi:modification methylase